MFGNGVASVCTHISQFLCKHAQILGSLVPQSEQIKSITNYFNHQVHVLEGDFGGALLQLLTPQFTYAGQILYACTQSNQTSKSAQHLLNHQALVGEVRGVLFTIHSTPQLT